MTVIAMTREMGTLGKEVAAGVAERLGIEVVHQELVERNVAGRMRLPETQVHRFLEGEASLWERWRIDPARVSRFTSEEVLELATRGNVLIRGWGAAQLLRDVPHVLCVRVCAPMSVRIAEMRRRLKIDDEAKLRREIERSDEAHSRAVSARFGTDWRDALGYAAVLNTGFMPVATATAMVLALAEAPAFAQTPESRAVLADRLTLSRVRTALDETRGGAIMAGGLMLSIDAGCVRIEGVVTQDVDLDDVEATIRGVPGVAALDNRVERVPFAYGP